MAKLRAGKVMVQLGVVGVLWAFAPAVARAQNLIVNGSFESGLSGWTLDRNDCSSFVNNLSIGPAFSGTHTPAPGIAEDGASDMGFGAVSCTPGISQSFHDIAGQLYNFQFWLALKPGQLNVPNVFNIIFDGSTVASGQVTSVPWQEFSGMFVGSGIDNVEFSGNNPNGVTFLDNVSVTAVTPEPATMTLVAGGIVGLFVAGRRRRRVVG